MLNRTLTARSATLAVAVLAASLLTMPTEPVAAATATATQSTGPCDAPAGPVELTSVPQVEDLLVAAWVRCNGDSLFSAGAATDVGLEFTDGHFYRLYQAADGTLIRAEGADQEGATTVLDNSSMNGPGSYQLNLDILGDGTLPLRPKLFSQPATLRLNQDGRTSDYVPWTGPPPTPGAPPGTGTGPCDTLKDPVALTSESQVQGLLGGSWIRCSGDAPFASGDTADVGFQFTDDGHFYRLHRAADGTLIRAEGADQEGSTRLLPMGPGAYQLNLTTQGGAAASFQPVFFRQPQALRLNGGMPGTSGDYVPWTGPPPTPGLAPGSGTGPCDTLRSPTAAASTSQVTELLQGRWVRCRGTTLFGADTTTDLGLEFVDGHVYRLYQGPDGTLIRGEGANQEGAISISDNSTADEPGLYQLNVEILGTGTTMFRPFFFNEPRALRLSGMSGSSDYLAWTDPSPSPDEPPGPEPPAPPELGNDGQSHHRHHGRHHRHCHRYDERRHRRDEGAAQGA